MIHRVPAAVHLLIRYRVKPSQLSCEVGAVVVPGLLMRKLNHRGQVTCRITSRPGFEPISDSEVRIITHSSRRLLEPVCQALLGSARLSFHTPGPQLLNYSK